MLTIWTSYFNCFFLAEVAISWENYKAILQILFNASWYLIKTYILPAVIRSSLKSWWQKRISGCFSVNLAVTIVIPLVTVVSVSMTGAHRLSKSIFFVVLFKYSWQWCSYLLSSSTWKLWQEKELFFQGARNSPSQLTRHNRFLSATISL